MAHPRKTVRFDELVSHAADIFAEMEEQHAGVVVERAGKLYSLKPTRQRAKRQEAFTERDSLFQLAGIGASEEPTDVAAQKDDYLADAYADHGRS